MRAGVLSSSGLESSAAARLCPIILAPGECLVEEAPWIMAEDEEEAAGGSVMSTEKSTAVVRLNNLPGLTHEIRNTLRMWRGGSMFF